MLLNQNFKPPQLLQFQCRLARCGSKLPVPVDDPRAAFCSKGCERAFYRFHCQVCETPISRKSTRRKVCGRSKCRHEFQRHPERYELHLSAPMLGHNAAEIASRHIAPGAGQNASRSAHSTGLKSDEKSGRGWRVVAGPDAFLDPINLQIDPGTIPASSSDKAFRDHVRRESAKAIFQRDTPPLNIIGGFKFSKAPEVDLGPIPPTASLTATALMAVGDGLEIPAFLRRPFSNQPKEDAA